MQLPLRNRLVSSGKIVDDQRMNNYLRNICKVAFTVLLSACGQSVCAQIPYESVDMPARGGHKPPVKPTVIYTPPKLPTGAITLPAPKPMASPPVVKAAPPVVKTAPPVPPKPSISNDPSYKKFVGGDGQTLYGPDPKFADGITKLIRSKPSVSYALPKNLPCAPDLEHSILGNDSLVAGTPFEQLMIAAVDPSVSQKSNPYVKLTSGYAASLKQQVLNSKGGITPADLLSMALSITGDNYPLAVLTCHNLIKDEAYSGRAKAEQLTGLIARGRNLTFPASFGDFASKLVTMRTTPGDKMGVYYHAFVPLTITAWTGSPVASQTAIRQEYAVRELGQKISALKMGSPVDPEKKRSDVQFAAASLEILKQKPVEAAHFTICSCHVKPPKGDPGTSFELELKYQLQGGSSSAGKGMVETLSVSGPRKASIGTRAISALSGWEMIKSTGSYTGQEPGRYRFEYDIQGQGAKLAGGVPFEVGGKAMSWWSIDGNVTMGGDGWSDRYTNYHGSVGAIIVEFTWDEKDGSQSGTGKITQTSREGEPLHYDGYKLITVKRGKTLDNPERRHYVLEQQ